MKTQNAKEQSEIVLGAILFTVIFTILFEIVNYLAK